MGKSEKGRNDKGLREGGREGFFFTTTFSSSKKDVKIWIIIKAGVG